MKKRPLLAAAFLGVVALSTPAAAMDVATFLSQADRVMRLGPIAMREFQSLSRVLEASNNTLRAERLAAERQGRRPAYCPDPNDRATPQEIFQALRAVPSSQRASTTVTDALRAFYARRHPCPS